MLRQLFYSSILKTFDVRSIVLTIVCCLLIVATNGLVAAATLPAGFSETLVANGLSSPTSMDFAPDGRLFVCLQGGQLRVIKNGSLLPAPFVSLTVNSSGERGLLGVAFDPNFATNNFVYVYYTAPTPSIHNRVSRFTANGDVAVAGSELVLLDLENLSATNHNGGAIHFGPDGKLYVAVGENAVPSNSQTLTNRLGKVLRINSDGSIPSDNPFFNTATGVNRSIWALGLRNPFTFAFQPGTGRLFINDVGQNAWEEINDGIAGSNYGWSTCEGSAPRRTQTSAIRCFSMGTAQPRPQAAQSSAVVSTIRPRSSFRRVMLANISSPIFALAGSVSSIPRTTPLRISVPAWLHPSI
jgi:glucose/arabinose dehydrogenase